MLIRALIPAFLLATSAQAADTTFRLSDVKRDGKVTTYTLEKAPTPQRGLFTMFACYNGTFLHAGQNAYDPKKEKFEKDFSGNNAEPDSFFLKIYPNGAPAYALKFADGKPGIRTKIENTCGL